MQCDFQLVVDGAFRESFLMRVDHLQWPNDMAFVVWCPAVNKCFRILTKTILEFHFMRTGVGPLEGLECGIPLDDIYINRDDAFEYWMGRAAAFRSQGLDSGAAPVCVEFSSHLFANRRRKFLERDRNTGLLVVCRKLEIVEDHDYRGPWPTVRAIPAG